MSSKSLERTAYTVECFLNALRLNDNRQRAKLEENLVYWLADSRRQKEDCLIYQNQNIACHSQGRMFNNYPVPEAEQDKTLWCNPSKLSIIDAQAFNNTGKLVMLGTAGLILTLPGMAAAQSTTSSSFGSEFNSGMSSNNNNNNNNNNG